MYAIVKTGGKQYRVEPGQRLLVERLAAEEGASVALEPILYRSEESVFDRDGLQNVQVTAKVLAHVRGEKLRVFKFKPKRGYKRRNGHRQSLSEIEVTDITRGHAKASAAKPAAEKPAAEKPATGKPAAGKAPAGKAASGKAAAGKAGADKASSAKAAKPAGKAPADKAKAGKVDTGKVDTGKAPATAPARKAKPKAQASKAKEESPDGS
jgi:large subunit ribosomal protein L21